MRATVREKQHLKLAAALLTLVALLDAQTAGQSPPVQASNSSRPMLESKGSQVSIPSRSSTPLFKNKQDRQKTEISFNLVTRMVTIKMLAQDRNGYFIPNLRRDNFVVYENGVRQQNANVEIEHASVSLALLVEFGGRSPGMNRELGQEVSRAARQLLEVVGSGDKIAIWKYSNKIEKLADFSQGEAATDKVLFGLGAPEFSEANLYDAVISMQGQMRQAEGRKGIVLISSGIDTFSEAGFDNVLQTVRTSDTPIYVISLVPTLRQIVQMQAPTEPLARVDWQKAEKELEEIARVSGGRAYAPESTIDLSATYDDLLENLKVRYVITYRSSSNSDLNSPRTIRIELVDPKTGGPLRLVDTNGKTIPAVVVVQNSYVPSSALPSK
jgi:VWFA-related protein